MHIKLFAFLITIFVLSALFTLPVFAQDLEACTPDGYADLIEEYAAQIRSTPGNEVNDLVSSLNSELSMLTAGCSGLSFEGKSSQVIGPVEFEDGTYIAAGSFQSIGSVTVQALEGECGGFAFIMMSMELDPTDVEQIFTADNCTGLFQVTGQGDWTVSFQRVN